MRPDPVGDHLGNLLAAPRQKRKFVLVPKADAESRITTRSKSSRRGKGEAQSLACWERAGALQRPLPDDGMKIIARGATKDGETA